jgi:DNA-binding SARP family transcriptional activator
MTNLCLPHLHPASAGVPRAGAHRGRPEPEGRAPEGDGSHGVWRIELLGGLRAVKGARVVAHFRTRKTGLLLAYLAYHRDRIHARNALLELFWPDDRLDAARSSLSTALSSLRQILGFHIFPSVAPGANSSLAHDAPAILSDHGSVWLNADRITTDVAEFQAALKSAGIDRREGERPTDEQRSAELIEALVRGIDVYRGELLPGHGDAWILQERPWLAEQYFQALTRLLALLERAGDASRALVYARRGLAIDPLREETHRTVMQLYAAARQPGTALRQYHDLVQLFQQELGSSPDPETQELARSLSHAARCQDRPVGGDPGRRLGEKPRPRITVPDGPGTRPGPPSTFPSGALPVDSPLYVARSADAEFQSSLDRRDGIVHVVGSRRIGKTSMLARGLQHARRQGATVLLTDCQMLDPADLTSAERLFSALARWGADQLGLEITPEEVWRPGLGASVNFERFLRRQVLERCDGPVVWVLEEVDRLLPLDWNSQVFGLFGSWLNRRSLDPEGPWGRLVLILTDATEAHGSMTDGSQSPFNVGRQILMSDFTCEQVAELNEKHGFPLREHGEVIRFHRLTAGHPYLTNRGLWEMAIRKLGLDAFEAGIVEADRFLGDHLESVLAFTEREPCLLETVQRVLQGQPCPPGDGFHTLRSRGILAGDSPREARLRCPLYHDYLSRRLL